MPKKNLNMKELRAAIEERAKEVEESLDGGVWQDIGDYGPGFYWDRRKRKETQPEWVGYNEQGIFTSKSGPIPWFLNGNEAIAEFCGKSEYLWKGILYKNRLYSFTGITSHGKTAIALCIAMYLNKGIEFAGRPTKKSKIAFFAGENPEVTLTYWKLQCEEHKINPDHTNVKFFALPTIPAKTIINFSDPSVLLQLSRQVSLYGPFDLIIIDSKMAYWFGQDENSNKEAMDQAHAFRALTQLEGNPAVMILCHPRLHADKEELQPRGAGSFMAEMDTGLVVVKEEVELAELHWHVKKRGPDFDPVAFRLLSRISPIKNVDGDYDTGVVAVPVDEEQKEAYLMTARERGNQLLLFIADGYVPGMTQKFIADKLGWVDRDGNPREMNMSRAFRDLKSLHLIKQVRGIWSLTDEGKAAVKALRNTKKAPKDDDNF